MKLTIEEAKRIMEENAGILDLNGTQYSELPEGLTVSGWLDLSYTQISSLPDELTVGGWLDLSYTQISSLPDELTVGGGLDLSYSQISSLPDGLTVGGLLNLSHTQISSLPDGLTVGGGLDLSYSQISSLPDGLTVGGGLDLSYSQISELPHGLTVGADIVGFHDSTSHVKHLKHDDYVPGRYLYADGMLTHVVRKKEFQNYNYFVGKIPEHNVLYDGTYYAHCRCIRDGIRDLAYKHASDRGADQYRNISPDQRIPTDKLVAMYRVITGACQQGTEAFLKSLGKLKDSYTIQEAVHLTEGQYGAAEFREFFEL